MILIRSWVLGVCLIACVAASTSLAPGLLASFQTADAGDAALQKKLDGIRADLFSRPDRVNDAIRELKEILAVDARLGGGAPAAGHCLPDRGSPDLVGEAEGGAPAGAGAESRLRPARFYLAHIYLDLGRAQKAREELEAALAQTPGQPQFLSLLGEAERQLENPQRSIEVNRQALQADASFAQARYYLGLALLDLRTARRSHSGARTRSFSRARKSPMCISASAPRISTRADFDEAIAILDQGTHIDPARPDLRIQLARAYRLKGLLDKG